MNIIFLESDSLGLLRPAFKQIGQNVNKRKRAHEVLTLCKILKGLKLLDSSREVSSLSLGYTMDGGEGLFIILKEETRTVLGQTGPIKGEQ